MTGLTRLIDAYWRYRMQGYGGALSASFARQHSYYIGDIPARMWACNDRDMPHVRVGDRII